jgi:hypothetical protein
MVNIRIKLALKDLVNFVQAGGVNPWNLNLHALRVVLVDPPVQICTKMNVGYVRWVDSAERLPRRVRIVYQGGMSLLGEIQHAFSVLQDSKAAQPRSKHIVQSVQMVRSVR